MKTVFLLDGGTYRGDSVSTGSVYVEITNPQRLPEMGVRMGREHYPEIASEIRIPWTNIRYIVEGE